VTSIEGCTATASVDVTNVRSAPMQPLVNTNSPICEDENLEFFVATAYSGTVSYTWTNGEGTIVGGNSASLSLAASAATAVSPFRVQVTVDGCSAPVSAPMEILVQDIPVATALNDGPVCNGGDATLTAGFIAGATYEWRVQGQPTIISTNRTVDVSNLTSTTTYELTVVRGECSSAAVTTTVTVNNDPLVSPSALYFVQPDCSPASLTLLANAGGGTAPYLYDWTGPNGFTSSQANPQINPATPANNGSYSLTIIDAAGCSATATVQVNNIVAGQPEPQITASGPTCEGGTVVLTVDEYNGSNVSYTWQTPAGVTQGVSGFSTRELTISPANSAIHEGLYSVTINVDGCVLFSDAYRVDVYEQPTVSPLATITDNCDGGRLELASNGATAAGALSYEWTGPNGFTSTQVNPVIDPATQANNGRYEVTVTNANGCTASNAVDVTGMLPPAETPTIDAPSICEGEDLVLTTSTSGTQFEWIGPNGASTSTLAMPGMTTVTGTTTLTAASANYLAGDWSVRVTDANGCVATSPAMVVDIYEVPVATPVNNGPHCTGTPVVLTANAVAGATYTWYDGNPAMGATVISRERVHAVGNLAAGTTNFFVEIEANGCVSVAASTPVVVYAAPAAAPTYSYTVAADCSPEDLTVNANPSAGLAPYTFEWTGPAGFTSTQENPVIASVDPSNNGSYVVVVTDANGCSVRETVEVRDIVTSVPEPVIASSGPTCNGGTVTLSTSVYTGSSVAYTWTMPSGIRISGQGTNTLVISGVDATVHDGNYSVEVSVDGCTLTSDAYVLATLPAPTAAPSFAITDACDGGSFSLSANGSGVAPLSYVWSGPNGFSSTVENPVLAQADQTANGTYTLAITSANGCTAIETVTVSGMLAPAETPTIDAPSICDGEDLVLTTSTSGTQFEWIGPNGASSSTLAMPGMTTLIGTTTLAPSSANYLSGDWSVRVTDANGCVATSPATAILISSVPVVTPSNTSPACEGEDVLLTMNTLAGATYAWYNGDPNAGGMLVSQERTVVRSTLAVGTHTYFAVLTVGGCASPAVSTTVTVNALPAATPTHGYSLQPDCSPGNLTLQANPAGGSGTYSYVWTGPNGFASTQANPAIANVDATYNGSYQVTVTDASGCSVTATTQVDVIVNPQAVPVINASGPACEGEEIRLSVAGYTGSSVNYAWTVPGTTAGITGFGTPELVISPASAVAHEGLYRVTVTVDGCVLLSDNYRVDVFEQPTVAPIATIVDNCDGGRIEFAANATSPAGLATFSWTGPNGFTSTQENPVIDPATTEENGRYEVTITSASGCVARQIVDVTGMLPPKPTPTIDAPSICAGEDLVLTTSSDGVQFEWIGPNGASTSTLLMAGMTTPTGTTTLDPTNANYLAGMWAVRVTDANGCVATSDVVLLEINDVPIAVPVNDGPYCAGEIAVLRNGDDHNGHDVCNWYSDNAGTPGALFSNEVSPAIADLAPGTHTYWLEIETDGCTSVPVATTIVINENPTVTPSFSYSVATDCSPEDLTLSANPAGGAAAYSFVWSGPNGFTSTEENPVIANVDANDNGSYRVDITDANGCVNRATVQVNGIVNTVAQPVIAFSGPTCEGGDVTLSTTIYTGSSVAYTWTMPSGVRVSGQGSPQLLINGVAAGLHDGNYTVEVVVDGCTLTSAPYTLTTLPAPSATPTFVVSDACDGGTVAFTANAAGVGPLSFAWSGPNGYTSTSENPVLAQADETYNGPYTLAVTSANGCVTTTTFAVSGLLPPAEVPTIDAPSVCVGEDLVLTTSTAGVRFEWIGPLGASPSTLALPGMTTNNGTTTLDVSHPSYLSGDWQVRVTDVNGCVSISEAIAVRISITPTVTASNTGAYCAGESAELIATAGVLPLGQGDTLTYAWYEADPSMGGLTPIAFGPNYTAGVLPEGQTTFWVTASLNGCTSTPATTVVMVNETPVLENLIGGGSYCEGDLITLSADQLIATTSEMQYTWTGPSGFSFSSSAAAGTPLSTDLTVDMTRAGTYTLTAATAEGCAAEPQSVLIEVLPIPETPTLTTSASVLCEGEDFLLTASQYTGTQSVSYVWTFDDGVVGPNVIATTQQPTYVVRNATVAQDGIYSVQVQLDGCPSFTSNEVPVTVFGSLTPMPTSNSTTAVDPACEGDIVRLNIQLIPGAMYEWYGPNNFRSQLPSPIVGPVSNASAGEYFATVTLNGCAAVVSQTTEVFVLPMPETPTINNDGPVCEGGDITLSVTSNLIPTTVNRSFEWYRASDNALLATTTDPNYTLTALDRTATGDYYVIMNLGACRTPISVTTPVQVDFIPANLADAGEDRNLCAVQTINLDAEIPTIGTGQWTSLTGNTVSNPDLYDSEVIDLIEGENIFVWTLSNGACMDYDADTVVFTISSVPVDVAYAGEDVTICGPNNASISALSPTRASGEWTQTLAQASRGVTITEPDSANTTLGGLEVGSMYTFFWTLSDGVCEEFAQDTVIVTISDSPGERALVVAETYYSCGEDDLIIDAIVPQVGTGRWSTTSGATIANPNSPTTSIERLDVGESMFVWTLSNGACIDYSSDTLIIVNNPMPQASNDTYVAEYETMLSDFEFMVNDVANSNDYTITFDTLGLEGEVIGNLIDGFEFMPERTFVGEMNFSYTICQTNCPDRCATANVQIRVMPGGECVAPSVITPNDDGYNDSFIVPCLADYPGSYLCVYNRWGDEVYQSQNYNNDWEGTFRDEPLPVGTYFYVLRVNDGSDETINGYVYIQR